MESSINIMPISYSLVLYECCRPKAHCHIYIVVLFVSVHVHLSISISAWITEAAQTPEAQAPDIPDLTTKMTKSIDIAQEPPEFTSYDDRDDKKWMNTVKHIDPKTDELKVYETLVASVGIYKWQGSTGSLNARHLSHIKPKWKNIKEFG